MDLTRKKRLLFLINPVSGGFSKERLKREIMEYIDHERMDARIVEPDSAAEAERLILQAVEQKYDIVAAVGGDGTINQVAAHLANTGVALGIIPAGSGNGYARSLGIPMNFRQAVEVLNRANIRMVDTGTLNGKRFVNVAGTGFDAHVAGCFQNSEKRGFFSYIKIVLLEFYRYKPQTYNIEYDGGIMEEKAFLVSVCLGNQYGNNAFIAPMADLFDGRLDITIIRNASLQKIPGIIWKLFRKSIRNSKNMGVFNSRFIRIKRNSAGIIHLDGDPFMENSLLEFQIHPGSLHIIV